MSAERKEVLDGLRELLDTEGRAVEHGGWTVTGRWRMGDFFWTARRGEQTLGPTEDVGLMADAIVCSAPAPSPDGEPGASQVTAFVGGEEGEPAVVPDQLLDEPVSPDWFDGEPFTLRELIAGHTNLWLKTIAVSPAAPSAPSAPDGEAEARVALAPVSAVRLEER